MNIFIQYAMYFCNVCLASLQLNIFKEPLKYLLMTAEDHLPSSALGSFTNYVDKI